MFSQVKLSTSLVALLLAALVSALLLIVTKQDPVAALSSLGGGAFGTDSRVGETLLNSTPLILTGLASAIAFKGGLFNIGAEGQLLMGAVTVAGLAPHLALPMAPELVLLLLVGATSGALWALIPGILKARFGSSEVITTLMMSYIAFYLSDYLIVGPFKAPGALPATTIIPPSTELPLIGETLSGVATWAGLSPTTIPPEYLGRLHVGFLIALAIAAGVSYLLARTVPGFAIRATGLNPEAARYGGIAVGKTVVGTMVVSGAIAGLGGAIQVMGVTYRMSSEFSPGFGFTGIAIALVGGLSSGGVILASVLFAALQTGGQVMQRDAGTPVSIVDVMQGLIIFFVAVQVTLPWLSRARTGLLPRQWVARWQQR